MNIEKNLINKNRNNFGDISYEHFLRRNKLYFIHNRVTGLEYGTLKIIRNLQAPFLDYNESESLGPEIFTEKTQLKVIHLHCNYLDFISNAKLSPLKS